ncbi:MAG: DUF3368 domain-containing protein [Dolichospermum sp.]|jgi:predicted nucleic acid-binding protein
MFNTCGVGAGYDCRQFAKQRSLIPQVQPVMDALINQAGFRISPQLYQRILTLSQEP